MEIERILSATLDSGAQVRIAEDTILALRYMLGINSDRAPALITAIKFVRLRYGLGLKDAKEIVDELRNRPHLFE